MYSEIPLDECVCIYLFVYLFVFFTYQLGLWVNSILLIEVSLCHSRCRLREESRLSEIELKS